MYASDRAVASNMGEEMQTSGLRQGSLLCFVATFASDGAAMRDLASSQFRKNFADGQEGMDWEGSQLPGAPDHLMHLPLPVSCTLI